MKRISFGISLFVVVLLAGCSLPGFVSPPASDGGGQALPTLPEVDQTQVAEVLTAMPTNTAQPDQPTPTEALPTLTLMPDQNQTASTDMPTPTATETATETPAEVPTATVLSPTEAPTATEQGTPLPGATATQAPAPSFTPPASDPRSRLGTPTSTDLMDDALNWIWPTGKDPFSSGEFSNGHMTLTSLSDVDGWRLANPRGGDFGSLYLEGTFNTGTCAGSDHYGLIARVPVLKDAEQGYLFGVTCDGSYSLRRWDGAIGTKGQMDWLVRWTSNAAIAKGSNQTNRLGLMTVGNRLILYVNGTLLTEVSDSSFGSGYFGVFIGSDVTQNLSVQVDEMSYWLNPQP